MSGIGEVLDSCTGWEVLQTDVIDAIINRRPRELCVPQIILLVTYAILNVISRIEHKGVPDHEYVCRQSAHGAFSLERS